MAGIFLKGVIVMLVVSNGLMIYLLIDQQQKIKTQISEEEIVVISTTPQLSESPKNMISSLTLLEPQDTITVKPNDVISIEYEGVNITEVLLVGPDFAESKVDDGTGRFIFSYRVPPTATEAITLSAVGKTDTGAYVEPEKLTLQVTLSKEEEIQKLRIGSITNDNTLLLFVGDTEQLDVFGTYSDGTERNITSTRMGTTYSISKNATAEREIIAVDDNGKITAKNPGQGSIVITNANYSGMALSVTVYVQ